MPGSSPLQRARKQRSVLSPQRRVFRLLAREGEKEQKNRAGAGRFLIVGVCLALLLLLGAARVLHTHAGSQDGGEPSSSCSLCVLAQLEVHPAPLPVLALVLMLAEGIALCELALRPCLPARHRHNIRPPPAPAVSFA